MAASVSPWLTTPQLDACWLCFCGQQGGFSHLREWGSAKAGQSWDPGLESQVSLGLTGEGMWQEKGPETLIDLKLTDASSSALGPRREQPTVPL